MAWENRRRQRYFYRSRRVGSRVLKEYLGRGAAAAAVAAEIGEGRSERLREQRAQAEFVDRIGAADGLFQQFDRLTSALVAAAMMLAGFRQHNRHEWRRTHG